jgi:hypothetical protein
MRSDGCMDNGHDRALQVTHPIPLPTSPLKGEETDAVSIKVTGSLPLKGEETDAVSIKVTGSLPFKGRVGVGMGLEHLFRVNDSVCAPVCVH